MPLKDILVHVDTAKTCAARLDTALQFARGHGAHITGLYIDPGLALPIFPEVPTTAVAEIMDRIRAEQDELRGKAESTFRDAAKRAGVAHEWRAITGDLGVRAELVSAISSQAHYTDIVVVSQTSDDDPKVVAGGLPDTLVMEAGRPILVVPYVGASSHVGSHVLIAWNNTREAVRAVNDALPILERAEKVEVLTVNPSEAEDPEGALPGADICLHLARHDVKAEAHRVVANDIDVGDALLSRAADMDADLIVMGAYGHSRMREFVLGGATRHLTQHMTVPVLLSH